MIISNGFVFASATRQLPEPKWYIDELMTEKSITMISAQPKEGKSAWCAHLTYSVATGTPFFGRDVPQGTVLYLAGERANQTEDRLRTLFDDEIPRNYAIFVPTMSNLGLLKFNREGDAEKLIREVQAHNMSPDLIVVDTLSQFYQGSQNDEEAMHAFFVGCRKLTEAFGACVVVIHHDTKLYVERNGQMSGGGSPRGSGDAFASVDSLIRGRTVKRLADPDDARGEKELRIVEFELEADNFGGSFKQVVAVRKVFEDPTAFLEADKTTRLGQQALMVEVLASYPDGVTTTGWYAATKNHPQFTGALGVGKFNQMADELIAAGQVMTFENPNRKNGVLYKLA